MSQDGNFESDGTDADGTTTDSDPSVESHGSSPYKVLGEIDSLDGTGVLGHNTATSGAGSGIKGVTDSPNREAAGVLGISGPEGSSGVAGYSLTDSANKVVQDTSPGVYGNSDVVPGPAVYGIHSATSDVAVGVAGSTGSPDGSGVRGFNTGGGPGIRSTGYLDVEGHVAVSDVGVSAYLSTNYQLGNGARETIVFDQTVRDDFGAYDTSTGVYTVPVDGDYHVDFLIDWFDIFSSGDRIDYELLVDGSVSGGLEADTHVTGDTDPARCFSKTLFGLTQGQTIEVQVYQSSGGGKEITGTTGGQTYMTIHRVG